MHTPAVVRGVHIVRTQQCRLRALRCRSPAWLRGVPLRAGVGCDRHSLAGARDASTARAPPSAAAATRLSFSGCGWLLPFHIGVAQRLIDAGVLPHGPSQAAHNTAFAGASGGALIAAALACGVAPAEMMAAGVDMAVHCRKHGTVGRLREPLDRAIRSLLPPDAVERLRAPGTGKPRLHVAVTRLEQERRYRVHLLRPLPVPLPTLVAEFKDRDDLVEALLTSSHVPCAYGQRHACRVCPSTALTLPPRPTTPPPAVPTRAQFT